MSAWPRDGVPRSPEAWLLTTARNRLADRARHDRVRTAHAATLELIEPVRVEVVVPDLVIPDERLKLLFVCAHPAIDAGMHTPLMLQSVLGLDAAAIARAFVVAPAVMSQRLVRAKAKIRDAGVAFEVPDARELSPRLEAVLSAIYAAYGCGWEGVAGANERARGLVDEAIWLARVLKDLITEEDAAEVHGLLALMLYCESRRHARRDSAGSFVPLSAQDPARWDTATIDAAERELTAAGRQNRVGRFQLEAAIQSVHADRARTGRTDWRAIAVLYEGLVRLSPTLGAHVGRAAAVGEAQDAAAGLALLDTIDAAAIGTYQPYWATRAHLLERNQRPDEAIAAFAHAIALAGDPAVRDFLHQCSGRVETGAPRSSP